MLFIHAHLFTMQPSEQGFLTIPDGFLLTNGAVITALGPMEECPSLENEVVIDLHGQNVYPGFIDAHCHMGLAEEGLNFEGDDLNEITDPVTPHLRGIDAINPLNQSFEEAVAAGITTVVTGPGSANAIGGQFCAIKTFGKNIDRMIVQEPVAMKFALGENPKNCYNDKSETPMTRMATAALIREQLKKAQRYYEDVLKAEEDETGETDPPDFDAKCDALLPVIKGELKAHFHCHRADDILTALRLTREFELDSVLVHCTEGYLIADELAEAGIKVITGPLMTTRSKPELCRPPTGTRGFCPVRVSPVRSVPIIMLCQSLSCQSVSVWQFVKGWTTSRLWQPSPSMPHRLSESRTVSVLLPSAKMLIFLSLTVTH